MSHLQAEMWSGFVSDFFFSGCCCSLFVKVPNYILVSLQPATPALFYLPDIWSPNRPYIYLNLLFSLLSFLNVPFRSLTQSPCCFTFSVFLRGEKHSFLTWSILFSALWKVKPYLLVIINKQQLYSKITSLVFHI